MEMRYVTVLIALAVTLIHFIALVPRKKNKLPGRWVVVEMDYIPSRWIMVSGIPRYRRQRFCVAVKCENDPSSPVRWAVVRRKNYQLLSVGDYFSLNKYK